MASPVSPALRRRPDRGCGRHLQAPGAALARKGRGGRRRSAPPVAGRLELAGAPLEGAHKAEPALSGRVHSRIFWTPGCVIRIPYAYCTHTILGAPPMGRKVRKTLNIDAEKLKQAREYLKLDTDTEVITRPL